MESRETTLALKAEAYTVAWLCAVVKVELLAASMMLDHFHKRPSTRLDPSDPNAYLFGDLNKHNVVLACMPLNESGQASAQALVAPLRQSFPNLKICLFVGIGGGVPRQPQPPNALDDIHLGDVVVGLGDPGSPDIIRHDHCRSLPGKESHLLTWVDSTESKLKQGLTIMTNKKQRGMDSGIDEHLDRLSLLDDFKHPGRDQDVLFDAEYEHEGDPSTNCNCCKKSRQIKRPPRQDNKVVFHTGTILSGDKLIMDAKERDWLSRKNHKGMLFEMEGAIFVSATHGLVIRGVSDFADSHKDPQWRNYAAGTAAAFAREYLFNMQPHIITTQSYEGNLSHLPQPSQGSTDRPDRKIPATLENSPKSIQDGDVSTWHQDNTQASQDTLRDTLYEGADQIFKHRRIDKAKLSQNLILVQDLLGQARLRLPSSGQSATKDHLRIYIRQLQVERERTFESVGPKEIDQRFRQAENYGNDALRAAERHSHLHTKISQVQLEVAYTHAGKVLWESRSGSDQEAFKSKKRDATQRIRSALDGLRESDVKKFEASRTHANWWITELKC